MPLFVLDNLRSAFNVGSVFRTAESVSPAGVILTGICCRPGGRKLAHTARGTQATVPWRYFREVREALLWCRGTGRRLVALEGGDGALPLWEAGLGDGDALFLGNEAEGLCPEVLRGADVRVRFPQSGRRDCINVSSTAAIAAAEIARGRWYREPAGAGQLRGGRLT